MGKGRKEEEGIWGEEIEMIKAETAKGGRRTLAERKERKGIERGKEIDCGESRGRGRGRGYLIG